MWTGPFYWNFADRLGRLLNGGFNSTDISFGVQYLSWFLLAGIVFVVLRILGQIPLLKTFLCQLVGSAVFLVPLVGAMPVWASKPGWWNWLWVEGAVAAGAALLYANRSRPATAAILAAAALFHFGLWGFVYFRNIRLVGVFETVAEMLLLPLVGGLAWAFYVWLLARPIPASSRHPRFEAGFADIP